MSLEASGNFEIFAKVHILRSLAVVFRGNSKVVQKTPGKDNLFYNLASTYFGFDVIILFFVFTCSLNQNNNKIKLKNPATLNNFCGCFFSTHECNRIRF